ncbi:MAG: hypothetical protein BWY04_01345 [candidate division CPR1 bacterium ADurb.Bin160]|jgi:hypothetical protein|uniref:Uncharacterized protein n=1 Tax=candidate division CPR1 bacterium ADurb.Bin160 TaxID=1852826 RepID=A0A1V5ZK33_9BACT|nr:MAG: hypothetical protein BWY04_01345 [candidate division CPR1 bacterium ADurb.Bin160]
MSDNLGAAVEKSKIEVRMSDNLGAAVEKSKTEASGNLKKSFS